MRGLRRGRLRHCRDAMGRGVTLWGGHSDIKGGEEGKG